jgi:hypothetical protein
MCPALILTMIIGVSSRELSWSVVIGLLGATWHLRLKAHEHGNVRALIGWKGGDRPSSLHTRMWRPKGPKKSSRMKSLHGVLHGKLWIRVHGLLEFASRPTPRGGPDANSGRPWLFKYIFQHDIFHDRWQGRFQNKFQGRQTSPNIYLKLIEFKTYYIKSSPLSANKACNVPATWSILTSHYAWGPVIT